MVTGLLDLLSHWQACGGPGPGPACAPVPCAAPPCPGTLPAAGWALGVSGNTTSSLLRAVAAMERHRQLLQRIRATASSAGVQAREMWRRARGAWAAASLALLQATARAAQRFLLGACPPASSSEGGASGHCDICPGGGLPRRAEADGSGRVEQGWRGEGERAGGKTEFLQRSLPVVSLQHTLQSCQRQSRPQGGAAGIALLLAQVQRALPAPGSGGQGLLKADCVLHRAQQSRAGTARAQGRALHAQGVLAEARAQTWAAEQGLQVARQTLGGLEASAQEVAGRLAQVTLAADVSLDLGLPSSAAVALRTQVALCQRQAQEAEEQAARALGLAGGLGKVRWGQWTLGCQGPPAQCEVGFGLGLGCAGLR
ncbi:uncharacterized protein LOC123651036 [Pipistrellus kuhlii]|uniref:uncharacterized protein LOC123651036 n=1 Tax=Pipistrellus kuhlii TaxID=59472 RepID=UPI001E26F615|nr:uncharacterized protein LOC123651036 [Pipistrellus kuhlii]